jgi:hypothetical protein
MGISCHIFNAFKFSLLFSACGVEKSNVEGKSMIYGVGTDIINIDRVEQILNKNKDGFVHRVLSEHEQALFANKGDSAAYCAKRFAAKEAFAKEY